MKFDRTKNATRNITFGMIQRMYQLIVPFLMRTAMIYWLGVEYLGLDGLFTSILSVLNLAELGVGSAMVYSMYKPIAEDDLSRVGALMKLYKLYYRIIGVVVLFAGLAICPFVPKLISRGTPNGINVYILYLLNLAATVLSYWLFAYKNSILQAYQRADIVSKVAMAVNTVRYILQFVVLFIFHNYYYYLIILLIGQICTNIATAIVATKMFPGLEPKGDIPKEERQEINHKIRDLFTAKVGAVVVNSVDTLVISAFLGLTVLAIYQNYYYIITALLSIIGIIISSCTAGIGNSIIVETKEKNYKDFQTFTFLIACVATFCSSCLICVFQPFMELWVGRELMFEMPAVVCFTVYFFIVQINTLLNNYKDAAGIWHEDRFRPMVTAMTNLSMNLILVHFWGIYGVLLSTVLSMLLIGMPWLLHNLFTTIFNRRHLMDYTSSLLVYALVACVASGISYYFGRLLPLEGIILIIARIMICFFCTVGIMLPLFHKREEYERAVLLLDVITHNRFKLSRIVNRRGCK